MINIPDSIVSRVIGSYGLFFERLAHIQAEKCAKDVLNEEKVHDQILLLSKSIKVPLNLLANKKLLEIGSGFGVFVSVCRRDYKIESFGIEPAEAGFDSSYSLSQEILSSYSLSPDLITNAKGENIPFPDNSFDIVFSSTVLEHTDNPLQVIQEAIRVLKPGGHLQFIFPNYGSFIEGHYALPWIPYLNNTLGGLWVKLWGRDPAFMKTLKLLNYFKIRRWMNSLKSIEVLSYGEQIFKQRMRAQDIKDWAGLGKLSKYLSIVEKMKLTNLITFILIKCKAFEPIILTCRKK